MKDEKIFVAGHNGMVGSAVVRLLKSKGYTNIVTRSRFELDLLDQKKVLDFFTSEKIHSVILCAAKVGGIMDNKTFRASYLYQNLQIALNVIDASTHGCIKKLINLGSSCIYPRDAKIPIKEEYLLTGELEKTNEPYAIAKIAALKLCESQYDQHKRNFFSIMPCNLYGPKDNFDLSSSHVLPALINKIHLARQKGASTVEVWGTGKPLREFLYVDDLADAIVYLLENVNASDIYSQGISHINCGSDDEVSISELANIIRSVLDYQGDIVFNDKYPDGTFRKKMDNSRMQSLGFSQKTKLKEGIEKTYGWYIKNL